MVQNCMVKSITRIQSHLNFLLNQILIRYSRSQIFELGCIFKGRISYLSVKILSCILIETLIGVNSFKWRDKPSTICYRGVFCFIYYYFIVFIIYFNCKWVFTRLQWYYNKTHHANNTNHTKQHTTLKQNYANNKG
jgi:hypothetical protein